MIEKYFKPTTPCEQLSFCCGWYLRLGGGEEGAWAAMYTILVTGSSRGIGFAIVSVLLNEFHDSVMVVGVARGKCSLEGHRNYHHVQGNVESPTTLNDVEELIRCLQEKKMPLVGVVYNAGLLGVKLFMIV